MTNLSQQPYRTDVAMRAVVIDPETSPRFVSEDDFFASERAADEACMDSHDVALIASPRGGAYMVCLTPHA